MNVIAEAASGLMSVTGFEDTPYTGSGALLADNMGGIYMALGVLAALRGRDASEEGKGSYVDVSMSDAMFSLVNYLFTRQQKSGVHPKRQGPRSQNTAPFDVYRTADDPIAVVAFQEHLYPKFCQIIRRPDLEVDPRFATNGLRMKNYPAFKVEVEKALQTRSQSELMEEFLSLGVPCGPVNNLPQALADPQFIHRNMVLHTADGEFTVPGNPIKISGYRDITQRPAQRGLDEDGPRIRAELMKSRL